MGDWDWELIVAIVGGVGAVVVAAVAFWRHLFAARRERLEKEPVALEDAAGRIARAGGSLDQFTRQLGGALDGLDHILGKRPTTAPPAAHWVRFVPSDARASLTLRGFFACFALALAYAGLSSLFTWAASGEVALGDLRFIERDSLWADDPALRWAIAIALVVVGATVVVGAGVGAVAVFEAATGASVVLGAVVGAVAVVGALAAVGAVAVVGAGALAAVGAVAGAVVGALAAVSAGIWVALSTLIFAATTSGFLPEAAVADQIKVLWVIVMVLPACNGALDWLSWSASRALGRDLLRGGDRGAPTWGSLCGHAVIDFALALFFLIALAALMPRALGGFNALMSLIGLGALAIDHGAYLCAAALRPYSDGVWVLVMLGTTLIPTALHLTALIAIAIARPFTPAPQLRIESARVAATIAEPGGQGRVQSLMADPNAETDFADPDDVRRRLFLTADQIARFEYLTRPLAFAAGLVLAATALYLCTYGVLEALAYFSREDSPAAFLYWVATSQHLAAACPAP